MNLQDQREQKRLLDLGNMTDRIAHRLVNRERNSCNANPEGEGWAFHAAENMLHEHEYTESRFYEAQIRVQRILETIKDLDVLDVMAELCLDQPERTLAYYQQAWEVEAAIVYECEICGCYHPVEWNGDCRDDQHRYGPGELDEKYGQGNWESVSQDVAEQYQAYIVACNEKGCTVFAFKRWLDSLDMENMDQPPQHLGKLDCPACGGDGVVQTRNKEDGNHPKPCPACGEGEDDIPF